MSDKIKKKKIISLGVFVIGLIGIIISACYDYLSSNSEPFFGYYQIAGVIVGVIIAVSGTVLFAMKSKE